MDHDGEPWQAGLLDRFLGDRERTPVCALGAGAAALAAPALAKSSGQNRRGKGTEMPKTTAGNQTTPGRTGSRP
jgi:hypothetical protein